MSPTVPSTTQGKMPYPNSVPPVHATPELVMRVQNSRAKLALAAVPSWVEKPVFTGLAASLGTSGSADVMFTSSGSTLHMVMTRLIHLRIGALVSFTQN